MNAVARPWIGLCFKLSAVLAVIFAFIFFMRMDEEQSRVNNYRNSGTVSKAVVVEKEKDTVTTQSSGLRRRSSGSTTENDIWVLTVRFDPKSTVKYVDYLSKVREADLPTAPAITGDPKKDGEFVEVLWVSRDLYDKTKIGDTLTVVDAPFSGFGPELVSDIRDFDPSDAYPKIAIALALALLLWLIGRRISKASMLRGIAAASTVPGTNP